MTTRNEKNPRVLCDYIDLLEQDLKKSQQVKSELSRQVQSLTRLLCYYEPKATELLQLFEELQDENEQLKAELAEKDERVKCGTLSTSLPYTREKQQRELLKLSENLASEILAALHSVLDSGYVPTERKASTNIYEDYKSSVRDINSKFLQVIDNENKGNRDPLLRLIVKIDNMFFEAPFYTETYSENKTASSDTAENITRTPEAAQPE